MKTGQVLLLSLAWLGMHAGAMAQEESQQSPDTNSGTASIVSEASEAEQEAAPRDSRAILQRDTGVPIDRSPDDPMASAEERRRRARELIDQRLRDRAERERQAQEEALERIRAERQAATEAQPEATPTTPTRAIRPTIQEGSQRPHITLFAWPASRTVQLGRQFPTEWRLLNPKHLPFNRIELNLSYPPANLRPVSIHHEDLEPLLEHEAYVWLDEQAGHLRYHATLSEVIDPVEQPVITVVWEALRPAETALIEPWIGSDISSAWWGRERQTATISGMRDSLLGSAIRIRSDTPEVPSGHRLVSEQLSALELGDFPPQEGLRPPTLWIDQPGNGWLEPGQWLVVDLNLVNPDRMVFDEVRLALKYDPNAVEVIDADRNNLIQEGVNILDGPFKRTWQWNHYIANRVDRERGLILYHKATSRLGEMPSGTVARIIARVKQPVQAPVFEWVRHRAPRSHNVSTGIYLMKRDVYYRDGLPGRRAITEQPPSMPDYERADPGQYRSQGMMSDKR